MEFNKYTFGTIAVIVFGVVQGLAFLTNHDGQIFAFTSSAITSIIAFLIGLNINPQKPSPSIWKAQKPKTSI